MGFGICSVGGEGMGGMPMCSAQRETIMVCLERVEFILLSLIRQATSPFRGISEDGPVLKT